MLIFPRFISVLNGVDNELLASKESIMLASAIKPHETPYLDEYWLVHSSVIWLIICKNI